VSDLIDLARDILGNTPQRIPHLAFQRDRLTTKPIKSIDEVTTCYYFRFAAVDRPGVLSKIAGILGQNQISIAAVIQKGRQEETAVPIVMLTHEALGQSVRRALAEIDKLDVVLAPTQVIRIENQETGILLT
jgi:homoserine dehydrogenase